MHVRSLFAVALAALLAGPATAHAQSKKSSSTKAAAPAPASTTSSFGSTYSLGGWVGYETGDLGGVQLRGDVVLPFQKLAPQLDLSFVGSVGYSYLTKSVFGGDVTANLLKFVPAARFTLPIDPQFSLFGDAGLGLYWDSVKVKTTLPFFGTQTASTSGVGFMLRFAVGGFYKLNAKTQLGVLFDLDPMFGDFDKTTFAAMAGATFQL